jgi:diguanylate cyclase (GGDEF)-like protein
VALVTVCILPFSTRQLGPQPSFVPAVMSTVFVIDLVTCCLLATRFRDSGDRRMLALAVAYVWSALVILGYVAAFPGVLAKHAPLGAWPSTAPWLYLGWHVGFPVLLGLAWCPWPTSLCRTVPPAGRSRLMTTSLVGVSVVAAGGVMLIATLGHRWLPVLIHGTNTVRMSELAGPPGVLLGVTSAVVVTHGIRFRRGPERWVAVTAWVCVADLVLTFASLHRFSVGWYAGRGMTVVATSLVFIAMLVEYTGEHRLLLAERGSLLTAARTDPLTGLANRNVLNGALDRRWSARATDCLILFDLDGFKAVNDTFGHPTGDAVLVQCAARLLRVSRPEDLVVRMGGDEFAVVLVGPLSDDVLGALVARLVEALDQPYLIERGEARLVVSTGASAGAARLTDHADVASAVAAADRELYRAKEIRARNAGTAHRLVPPLGLDPSGSLTPGPGGDAHTRTVAPSFTSTVTVEPSG